MVSPFRLLSFDYIKKQQNSIGDFYKSLAKVFNMIAKIYLNVEFMELPYRIKV